MRRIALVLLVSLVAGCSSGGVAPSVEPRSPTQARPVPSPRSIASPPARPRPPWLGTRPLPPEEGGFGAVLPTPPQLRDRRLVTIDHLPTPGSRRFSADITPVPRPVLRRSTWHPGCPVAPDELRYVTLSFWGFDQKPHTGELLVHRDAAEDVVRVFKTLYQQLFPIEEMRITTKDELDARPTGDGNNSGAFVCRASRGSSAWSEHAYGLAIDVNPFHNPYVREDVVLPELASAYRNRSWKRPGMVLPGGPVVKAFAAIGWSWGGRWSSAKDWMHFSATGR